MSLVEKHSMVGWLFAPDRAHGGQRGPTMPHGPLTCEASVSQNRMEVHTGQGPSINISGNTSQSQRTLKLCKPYKEQRYGWHTFVYLTGVK